MHRARQLRKGKALVNVVVDIAADEVRGVHAGRGEGEVGRRNELDEPQDAAGQFGIRFLRRLSAAAFDDPERPFKDVARLRVRHNDALRHAVRGEHRVHKRSVHDQKEFFVGLFAVRVIDMLLQLVQKKQIARADAVRLVPRLDVSRAGQDEFEVVAVPHRTVLVGMVDDIVGIWQRSARHGKAEEIVGVRAFVEVDDLVFAVVSHGTIIARRQTDVNAEKEV